MSGVKGSNVRGGRLLGATILLALVTATAPSRAVAAPAPLSADHSPVRVASSFGGGAFGRWSVDRFGLPAYRYRIDEQRMPWAKQTELDGDTAAQHELGNDHIVVAAYNHGYTQLWSQDRLAQWANRYSTGRRPFRRWLRLPQPR